MLWHGSSQSLLRPGSRAIAPERRVGLEGGGRPAIFEIFEIVSKISFIISGSEFQKLKNHFKNFKNYFFKCRII